MKLIAPKSQSETGGGKLPERYEEYPISESGLSPEEIKIYLFLDKITKRQIDLEKRIKKTQKNIKNQTFKIIEIVGLFSAILAIVLIDISIIKSAQTFLAAILLISALTCSLSIFAFLIHSFFSSKKIIWRKDWRFLTPFIILSVLIIVGIILFSKETRIVRISLSEEQIPLNGLLH